jgi:very-short-patch-repair endonuclease
MPTGIYKHKKGYKRPPFSEEWKENIRKAITGKKHSLETKKKIGEFSKGRHPTLETRIKIGKSRLERKRKFGFLNSSETRKKINEGNKGKRNENYYRKIGLSGILKQQNFKKPTSIEKIVYDFLKSKGIIFEKQKLINGKFLVDIYIPSTNTIIEVDGDYWHNLDRVRKKDKAENAYLSTCGFNLLRLSEKEINNGGFKERRLIKYGN